MEPKIGTLKVEGFRAFRSLEIGNIGRVNLITGRNNTGKSSILEALRILATLASPAVLYEIIHSREEDSGEKEEWAPPMDSEGVFPFSNLFHGFPRFPGAVAPIVIATSGEPRPMELVLEVSSGLDEVGQERQVSLVSTRGEQFTEGEAGPGLLIKAGRSKRLFQMDRVRPYGYRSRMFQREIAEDFRLPCVFSSPYGGERTSSLGALWDKVALSDREQDIVEALRLIDEHISAVSMVGGEGPRGARTAIVRSSAIPRPVPLRSFGDGLNRLFGIVLSLVNAKDGLLLIDEIENGMHHTVQLDVWRAIFRLSRNLNIQVFATSHSWDSVEAFQRAAAESPEDGVLIRLSRKGEDIIPTTFREDELAVVTRDRIEVR